MKVRTFIYILIVSFLCTSAMLAEPIEVLNHSFEYADGELVGNITVLFSCTPDYWEWGSGAVSSNGVEWPESDGDVCAALNAEESIYQLLDHTIAAGDEYTLMFDAYYLWSGGTYDCTFQGRLYYDDDGERVVIDYVGDRRTDAYVWHYDYTLYVNMGASSPAVGKQLGIELATVSQPSNSWFGFDNVRLDGVIADRAIGPYPDNGQREVPRDVSLSWQIADVFVDPIFDVYFSDDEEDVITGNASAFKDNRSEMSYTPQGLEMTTCYYWRIDVVDQSIVHPGMVWNFSTIIHEPNCLLQLADLNVDCVVDLRDLLIFSEQWLEAGCIEPWCADVDMNNNVNMADFGFVAEEWGKAGANVVISEFMASNTVTWTDDDGFFSDWIELKNLSTEAKNLEGWRLINNISDPLGWQIPDVTIEPGECKIIYASSNNRTDPNYPLHTDFNLDIVGEYLALARPDGTISHVYTPEYPPQAEDISYGLAVPLGETRFTYGYFLEPSPGANNVSITVANLGPYIENVTHAPSQPNDADDVIVNALIRPKVNPVSSVTLYYRAMFGGEVAVTMHDDGAHDDVSAQDGVYGAVIPASASSAGQMLRYRIVAVDIDAHENGAPVSLDELGMRQSPEYFGTVIIDPAIVTNLPVLYWFVQNTDAANTRTGTRASLFYNGEFYDNIFVRIRGGSITWLPKKSYKFEFNKGYYFRFRPDEARVDEFNLNASYPDKAYIRQVLSFETYRDAGVPYSISFPMRVQRNDDFFSVAFFIEQPDEDYLIRQQMDPEGALYKMYSTMTSDSSEKKTRLYEDHSDLWALINGLAQSGDAREHFVFDNINIPVVVNYAAATTVFNDYDHGAKNYYAYRDTNGTREWLYLPWDKDLTFGKMWDNDLGLLNDTLYYYNPWGVPIDEDMLNNGSNNALLYAIYIIPRTREMYYRRLRTLHDQLLKEPGTEPPQLYYENRADELYGLMNPDVILDYNEWANPWAYGQDQSFAQAIEYLKVDFLEPRRTHVYVTRSVDNGGPFPHAQIGNPTINFGAIEFNPASSNQDEEYIELINPNSAAVDISYWRLTGAVEHTFRPGTVIPAGDSLYASPDVTAFRARDTSPTGGEGNFAQGNYKGHLSSWGETIDLLAADGSLIDTITYAGSPSDQQKYLRITELMYHPTDPEPSSPYNDEDFEYIELKNISSQPLGLNGVKLTDGVIYEFPSDILTEEDISLVAITDSWRYEQSNVYPGDDWITSDYVDSSWPQGQALLYVEDSALPAPKNTPLIRGANTYYFRRHFNLDADPNSGTVTLEMNTVIDDGAVFYLNGVEVYRIGMPDGEIEHSTFASRTIYDAYYEGPFAVPVGSLNKGDNVIAVEVHQVTLTSSDIVFGLTLDAHIEYSEPVEPIELPGDEYILLVKNRAAFESRYSGLGDKIAGQYVGSLDNGGEILKLEDCTNSTILEFDYDDDWYDITDGGGFSLVINDPNNPDLDSWDSKSAWRPSASVGGSPGTDDTGIVYDPGTIVINEILAHSDVWPNDWIELHNTTAEPVNIGGWFLSDNNNDDPNYMKYKIATGTVIDPNGYIVFTQDDHFGNINEVGCIIPFALSENGEAVYLRSATGDVLTGYYEEEDFGASEPEIAFGRYQKSTGAFNFVAMSENTPGTLTNPSPYYTGAPNVYPKVGPIVISEIMYHPQINADAEYAELLNISGSNVTLYNFTTNEPWRFVDDEDNLGIEFYFPDDAPVTVDPDEIILLIKNAYAFKAEFGQTSLDSIKYYEWLDGSLSNGGEKPELQMPGDELDGVRYYIRVDRVSYDDESPWPIEADGSGQSLTKKSANLNLYGNDPNNWQPATPSPAD